MPVLVQTAIAASERYLVFMGFISHYKRRAPTRVCAGLIVTLPVLSGVVP